MNPTIGDRVKVIEHKCPDCRPASRCCGKTGHIIGVSPDPYSAYPVYVEWDEIKKEGATTQCSLKREWIIPLYTKELL